MVYYVAKVCMTYPATPTQTARDAIAGLEAAIAEAERRLGHRLLEDYVDADTGELEPLTIVSDNGPGLQVRRLRALHRLAPRLAHVRTRYRSPQNIGIPAR